jgi:hypothetical protein
MKKKNIQNNKKKQKINNIKNKMCQLHQYINKEIVLVLIMIKKMRQLQLRSILLNKMYNHH